MTDEMNFEPKGEKADRSGKPWIGVRLQEAPVFNQPYTFARRQVNGPQILRVTAQGPADLGGIKSGDMLLRIGDIPVETPDDVTECLHNCSIGDVVAILVRRNNEELTLKVQIGSDPSHYESSGDYIEE